MKTERTQKRILFVPCVTKGNGIGHLRRCLDMAQESGAKWYILFPAGSSEEINRRKEILASFPALINSDYILNELKDDQKWYRIILDKKTTTVVLFSETREEFPSGIQTWFHELDFIHAPEIVKHDGKYYIVRVSGPNHANKNAPEKGGWLEVAEFEFQSRH